MQTLSGGTVRYVDVDLLPCPEDATLVGQCEGLGALEVIWQGCVVETFALGAGDVLLVADGAVVAPDTQLVRTEPWSRTLRAGIPAGALAIARWSEPLREALDEITGLGRPSFQRGEEPIRLELRDPGDGALLAAYEVDRSATPLVESGAVLRRGDRIAAVSRDRVDRDIGAGLDTLRALLDARLVAGPEALVAPCDGVVEAIDRRSVALRASDGRLLRIRIPPERYREAQAGDTLRAGDAITSGERSHHALLQVWGKDRFAEHLLEELEALCGDVPRVYWALAVRAMLERHRGLRGFGELARARARRRGAR